MIAFIFIGLLVVAAGAILVYARLDLNFKEKPVGRKCWFITPAKMYVPGKIVAMSVDKIATVELHCGTRISVAFCALEPRYGYMH